MKDHDEEYYVIRKTVIQQQFGNLKSVRKLNILRRQDHMMIDIKKLINDQLEKAV